MSPQSPTHPSQAVERIREIIVGRRLDHLENRLARIEAHDPRPGDDPAVDHRLTAAEAQLESLRDHVRKLADRTRDETTALDVRHREEIQRMAALIQQSSSLRSEPVSPQSAARLEQKISHFLGSWQTSLQQHLIDRESRLVNTLNQELVKLRAWAEARIQATASQSVSRPELDQHLSRLADAARTLADAIQPQATSNRTGSR
jgi:hypothetical protein